MRLPVSLRSLVGTAVWCAAAAALAAAAPAAPPAAASTAAPQAEASKAAAPRAAASEAAAPRAAALAGTPAAAVEAFYRFHLRQTVEFTARTVAAHRQFLSAELARLCDAYLRRPEGADAELMVESDPFTDGEELPTSFRVESTSGGDAKADVLVALSGPGTVSHRVTVALVREGGAWKIANLSYGDGPTFRDLLIGHR